MLKKIMLLAALAFALASTVGATGTTHQYPTPPCLPCGGGSGTLI